MPIVTPEEMRAADAAAPEPVEVLVERAGAAVARAAVEVLGGTYGRRVVVIAGKGNNGADGRAAAVRLRRRGARVTVVEASGAPGRLPPTDLVVDAAYGTGFRGRWDAPDAGGAPVLAVDIPSGVDGLTGEAAGGVLRADRTVTFAALKPGLLLGQGRELAGTVQVVDIGLDVGHPSAFLVEAADVAAWLPRRPAEAHKWEAAVWLVAGSPGMTGAAFLAARGAQRAGAGYVRLSTPGGSPGEGTPVEAVGVPLPATAWAGDVLGGLDRFRAALVGPGLGPGHAGDVRRLAADAALPLVVDGDGLSALGTDVADHVGLSTVLTPHDGEYRRLTGAAPEPDRLAAARRLAGDAGCTVLLKGTTTVVAGPEGRVLVSTTGGPELATAGTGDVLAGVIVALLAQGLEPLQAGAAGAFVHGWAGSLGPRRGMVAGDLPDLLPCAAQQLQESRCPVRRSSARS